MADVTYEGYVIKPRPGGPAGTIAFVTQGSNLVTSITQPSESAAVESAKRWVDALATLNLPAAVSAIPVPVAEGGTNATSLAAAQTSLDILPKSTGGDVGGPVHMRAAGNVIPFFESTDNNAVQIRLQTDSTNRRLVAVLDDGSTTTSFTLKDDGAWQVSDGSSVVKTDVSAVGDMYIPGDLEAGGGEIKVTSAGDAKVIIEADTDDVTETDNAWVKLLQDGGAVQALLGLVGTNHSDPEGNTAAGAIGNATILAARSSSQHIQFSISDVVRATLDANGLTLEDALGVASGGTGSTTASGARSNLGLGALATVTVPLATDLGGTGADNSTDARQNLDVYSRAQVDAADSNVAGTAAVQRSLMQAEIDQNEVDIGTNTADIATKAPTVTPVFTGPTGITVPATEAIRIDSSTSDSILTAQDGTGRIIWLWNATIGAAPTFLTGNEDAWKMLLTTDGQLVWYWADGAGTTAGDSLTWVELFRIHRQYVRFRAGETSGQTSDYLEIRGSDSGRPAIEGAGGTNVDVEITPKGTGRLRFGTYTAWSKSTTSTGYVEAKTADGNTVYLLARTTLP